MIGTIGGPGGLHGLPDDAAPEAPTAPAAAPAAEGAVVRGPAKVKPSGPARSPEQTAVAFYDAFAHGRFDEMESIYAPDVKFRDPLFDYTDRKGTMGMWRTLLGGGGAKVTPRVTGVEGDRVHVHWDADYELAGRPVHNSIDATLTIKDGKIVAHEDKFSWAKWARQALPLGKLGETEAVHKLVSHLLRWGVAVGQK